MLVGTFVYSLFGKNAAMQHFAHIFNSLKQNVAQIIKNPKANVGIIVGIGFYLAAALAGLTIFALKYWHPSPGLVLWLLNGITGLCAGFDLFLCCLICAVVTVAMLDMEAVLPRNFQLEVWVYGLATVYCAGAIIFGVWAWLGAAVAFVAAIPAIALLTVGFCHDNETARKRMSRLFGFAPAQK